MGMSEENKLKQSERARAMIAERKAERKKKENWRDDKINIKIHKMEGVPDPVFVGVNGVGFGIKPGETVSVPKAVLEVLENSNIETKEYTPDPLIPNQYTVVDVTIPRFAVSTREV